MMIGVGSSPAGPRTTSTPLMPGRPMSRITTSGWCSAASSQRLLAGRGEVDLVVAGLEVGGQRPPDLGFVVDDEDPGHPAPVPGSVGSIGAVASRRAGSASPSGRRRACRRATTSPPMAVDEASHHGEAETDAARAVSSRRWNGSNTGVADGGGDARTAVDDAEDGVVADHAGLDAHRRRPTGRGAGRSTTRLATTRSSSGRRSARDLGARPSRVDLPGRRRPRVRARRPRPRRGPRPACHVRPRRPRCGSCRAGWRPARLRRSASSSMVAANSWRWSADQSMSSWSRLVDGRLDRRQRRAQVVGHGPQDGGAELLALGSAPRPAPRIVRATRRSSPSASWAANAASTGRSSPLDPPGTSTSMRPSASSTRSPLVGSPGSSAPGAASTASTCHLSGLTRTTNAADSWPKVIRRWPSMASSGIVRPGQSTGERGERLGLGPRPAGLAAPPGRLADENAGGDTERHEHDEGDDLLGILDVEGRVRLGEEPVDVWPAPMTAATIPGQMPPTPDTRQMSVRKRRKTVETWVESRTR